MAGLLPPTKPAGSEELPEDHLSLKNWRRRRERGGEGEEEEEDKEDEDEGEEEKEEEGGEEWGRQGLET